MQPSAAIEVDFFVTLPPSDERRGVPGLGGTYHGPTADQAGSVHVTLPDNCHILLPITTETRLADVAARLHGLLTQGVSTA